MNYPVLFVFVMALCLTSLSTSMADTRVDLSDKFKNAKANLLRNASEGGPYRVKVRGLMFWAHPNVFSPKYFRSSEIYASGFPYKKDERFLEIGSGVGVTSVLAALEHNNTVVALDINPDAVATTLKNAQEHGVTDRLCARQSDVFSALSADETFDTIYWDYPYVWAPQDHNLENLLEASVCDPGYKHFGQFLEGAPMHMNKGGRIFIGFGTNGDLDALSTIIKEYGYTMDQVFEEHVEYRGGISYYLFELKPEKGSRENLS